MCALKTIMAVAMLAVAAPAFAGGTVVLETADGHEIALDRDAVCKNRVRPVSHNAADGRVVTRAFINGDVRVTHNATHNTNHDVCGAATVRIITRHRGGGGDIPADTTPTTDTPPPTH